MSAEREKCAVYRLFDASGNLLYVGVSNNPELRYYQHGLDKTWWPEVAEKVAEWHPDRRAALDAESAAIVAELPRYNRQGHPDHRPGSFVAPEGGITVRDFRAKLSETVNRVIATGEPLILYGHGKRVAALVPADVAERMLAERATAAD